jgi:cytochrome P450
MYLKQIYIKTLSLQGSIVTVNLFTVHHDDESFWQDPEIFRPERHLSPDGRTLIKTDHLLPFSAGIFRLSLLMAVL